MKRLSNVHQRIALALFVGVVAVPITSTALFIRNDALKIAPDGSENLRQSAFKDRSRLRAQRRIYWQAIEKFQDVRRSSADAIKPDFNNTDSIQKALGQDIDVLPLDEQAAELAPEVEEPAVSSLTTNQLKSQDRSLLRRYTRAGFCPESLKGFRVPGFNNLCKAIVGDNVLEKPITGFMNHNANLYRMLRPAPSALSKFKQLQLMMQQANDRSNRRDPGQRPMRPDHCVQNPNC